MEVGFRRKYIFWVLQQSKFGCYTIGGAVPKLFLTPNAFQGSFDFTATSGTSENCCKETRHKTGVPQQFVLTLNFQQHRNSLPE